MRLASALCGGSFFDGAALAVNRTGAREIVELWISGICDVWRSARDAGLAIDPEPVAESCASYLRIVSEFLALYERGSPFEEDEQFRSPPWQALAQIWRFEVYRIGLMGAGNVSWRDASATSRYPGVL